MIKLSIVTPTFNRREELKNNIASVLVQTFANIEHIIIDNMSNDGTEDLINNYIKEAPYPVIYIREPDHGIYNAMNKGIQRASGKWIHILNSDDCYDSSVALQKIFQKNVDEYEIIANGIICKSSKYYPHDKYWKPEYKKKIRHFDFPHPGIIIKNQFYKTHGLYSERFKIVSDAIYVADNFYDSKYLIIDEPLVQMSIDGISNQNSFLSLYETVYCILFHHKFPFLIKIYYSLRKIGAYLIKSRFRAKKK
jgi:glycosyltransferase involved in cell wall biosynthesis